MKTTGGEKNGLKGGTDGSPAIWIYPQGTEEIDVEVELTFHAAGFMTSSTPSYNGLWRVHIDPKIPYRQYSSTYLDDAWVSFLDYDGFREGSYQTSAGWCVKNEKDAFVRWHRQILAEYGFTETEVDDVVYTYVRMLLDRQYPEKYFLVYPQDKSIVDGSVSLKVTPQPDSVSRLWLYFVPTDEKPKALSAPPIERVKRSAYAVVELAYLTDREIPKDIKHTKAQPGHRLLGRVGAVPVR